ncbi:hypothetical protein [Paraglaciecola sp.]|uniref:hypothetical protein n=1 Tax=Paraglaciecola sp. TaxID=1920173 RepID=UPI003EF667AA
MNLSQFLISIKKEYWEHRKSLFWLPILVASVIVAVFLTNLFLMEAYQVERIFNGLSSLGAALENPDAGNIKLEGGTKVLTGVVFGFFVVVALVVQINYFSACLFDDRRDLSVFFWRSMPVSDSGVIASKLLMGALGIPLIFITTATLLVCLLVFVMLVVCLVMAIGYDVSLWAALPRAGILSNVALVWASAFVYAIWMFPVFAWLMLTSAFANKSPLAWAIIPIILFTAVGTLMYVFFGVEDVFLVKELFRDYFALETGRFPNTMNGSMERPGLIMLRAMWDKVSLFAIILGSVFMYGAYWLRVNRSQG